MTGATQHQTSGINRLPHLAAVPNQSGNPDDDGGYRHFVNIDPVARTLADPAMLKLGQDIVELAYRDMDHMGG